MILSSFLLTYVVCYFNFNPWQLGSLKLEWALSSLTGECEKTGLLEKKTGFLLQGPEYYHLLSGGGFATPMVCCPLLCPHQACDINLSSSLLCRQDLPSA